ncbi:MAG: cyclic nucleotide-binding domain-containing protein [Ectothiorhodospiraceae bacterium]|nr:cyclic nucleotide-binding domain-containing protein [Ectothiorhodospiraceae bacterium]
MISELEQVSLFSELNEQALQDINQFCTRLELEEGYELISENDKKSNDLFILCSGRVEIVTRSSDATSSESILSQHEKELFGEISWITGRKRTATVRCVGEVEAILIDGKRFMSYLQENPETGFLVMRAIARLVADSLNHTDQLLKQILWNTPI